MWELSRCAKMPGFSTIHRRSPGIGDSVTNVLMEGSECDKKDAVRLMSSFPRSIPFRPRI